MSRISSQGSVIMISDDRVAGPFSDIASATKAKPCVVTLTTPGPHQGDIVVPRGTGWATIDQQPFKVSNVDGDLLTLEDSDTSSETSDIAAGANVEVPIWVEMCRSTMNLNQPAGATIDTTTLCDVSHRITSGLPAVGTWAANGFYDVDDAALPLVRDYRRSGRNGFIDVRMRDGSGYCFAATVNTYDVTMAVNAAVATNLGGNIDGEVCFYKTPPYADLGAPVEIYQRGATVATEITIEGAIVAGSDAGGALPRDPWPAPFIRHEVHQSYGQSEAAFPFSQPLFFTVPIFKALMPVPNVNAAFKEPRPPGTPAEPFNQGWDAFTGLLDKEGYGRSDPEDPVVADLVGTGFLTCAINGYIAWCRDNLGRDPDTMELIAWSAALGGMQWAGLQKPAPQYNKLIATVQRASELIAAGDGLPMAVRQIMLKQGQADTLGTVATSRFTYRGYMLTFINDVDVDLSPFNRRAAEATGGVWLKPKMFMMTTAARTGATWTDSDDEGRIAWAQWEASKLDDRIVFVTSDYFSNFNDTQHNNHDGHLLLGDYNQRALRQVFGQGYRKAEYLEPLRAWYQGNQFFVQYKVPTPPLRSAVGVIPGWAATDQMGYRTKDEAGDIALTNPAVVGAGDIRRFDAARPPQGSWWKIQYASDWPRAGSSFPDHGEGDEQDSTTDLGYVTGRPIPHWAPHFQLDGGAAP